MGKDNVVELSGRDTSRDELTELICDGARKLIGEALEAEVSELLWSVSERRDASGRAAVVRNGYQPEREIQTGIGPVTVKVPKVRSRDGEPVSFRSALVPPYVRKSARLEAALPWLYLKGISTGEMAPALEVLVGAQAKGLSASTVSRLKQQWREDYESWRHRRLDKDQCLPRLRQRCRRSTLTCCGCRTRVARQDRLPLETRAKSQAQFDARRPGHRPPSRRRGTRPAS